MKHSACGKHLLLALIFVWCSGMSALAFNAGDYVYTKVAKYRITGKNLVTNGQFTGGSTEGWTAMDESTAPLDAVFAPLEDGTDGVQVLPGQTALIAGMYQAVHIDAGGTYVVSFKVKGATAGFTDHDMTGAATNYINAYFNTDGALASVDGTNLLFGENGVNGGYQFDFGAVDFTEVCFAVAAPQDGNIMIDFRGLADGLIIKDVVCHTAEEVYDDRIALDRVAYFKKYLEGNNFEGKEYYAEFQAYVKAVEDAVAAGASPADMATHMENLEGGWTMFVDANFSNVLDLVATKDGSAATGNNSANWMNWTSKWNKLNQYTGKAPWTWSTDRWAHKTAAANSPMQIQWMRGAGANDGWNNIATLTTTLAPGTYYWGVTGQGGMMTLNKNRWARSWANECAETKLFFNGDTVLVGVLDAARNEDYVVKFELTEEKEVTLGLICNNISSLSLNAGFDVQFYNPVLYMVKGEGYSPEEKAYVGEVNDQIEALKARIDVANEYLSDANTTLTWGKEALRKGTNLAQARYDEWTAMDTTTILDDWYRNDISLRDTIMNNGTRFLNSYINSFIETNVPLTDMPVAIAAAWETLNRRIYTSSSKKGEYEALIIASESLYAEMLKSEYSDQNAAALIAQKAALEAMAEEFKAAINATTVVDIDFGTQDAPAQFNVYQDVDTLGEIVTYYTIEGAKGSMTFTDIYASYYPYALGWGNTTDEAGVVIATDSLGMLRVGNSEAVVEFLGTPVVEAGGILNIQFDYYYGNLSSKKAGYKVLSAEGDIICGLFCSKYSGNDDLNTFGVDYNGKISSVGSSMASNSAIAAASNKTHFDIVLDYGTKTMYCTTSGSKGTVTTEVIALPESIPAKFVLYSNYNNADRRCWFDNLKIQNISTEEETKFYAMYAQDVEAAESSTVNIPIVMDNSMPISAFQFDLYLPVGVTPVCNTEDGEVVYDITLDGARSSSSHVVTASKQPDGALRIVAYSVRNECFKGNEGVLIDVAVKIAKGMAVGDYPVVVRNARMVEADVTEYKAVDHTATLTVVRGFIMGDVNSDEQHTMADVVMQVNAVLNIAQANYNADAADMNGDGTITMADVVLVLRLVLGYDQVAAVRSMAREASAVAIETGNAVAGNNGEIILPVYMNSEAPYTAFQMDVVLPEGMSLANATLGARAKSSHSIAWSALDNGAIRIVAFAMDNATFNDNAEALAYLTLKPETAIADDAVLTLTEGLFVTANGTEKRADDAVWRAGEETTGINGVATACRIYGAEGSVVVESATDAAVTVYTVTGQLVLQAQVKAGKTYIALPAGVYVVNGYKVAVR